MARKKKDKCVAIYCRSAANSVGEKSIKSQVRELLKYTENNYPDLDIHIYKDHGCSGSTLNRPSLDRLRIDAANRKIDVVLTYDRARIARTYVGQQKLLSELTKLGISIDTVTESKPTTPEEEIFRNMQNTFALYECNARSKRAKQAWRKRRKLPRCQECGAIVTGSR